MQATAQREHQWLGQLVGNWTFEHESACAPDQPKQKFTGSEHGRMLGDLWIVLEGKGNMPGGGEGRMLMTVGYDPQRGTFVGTWVGSMMTCMFVYEGSLDESSKRLTLNTVGPSWDDPAKQRAYRDTIEIKDENTRYLISSMQADDGTWTEFMRVEYHRAK
ncbi:MAG: DUF1579 domain-containing protein [Phycisphaeraceae bacterium]|nr:DUF1579 domain-containing protein [Phycisphaeraceae bacterium]